ncbi:hypothetical protein [Alteromonas oceanisediminis]|uniref:hypothetical protein n=1 Tax=Alteromonas oceanisediminis TaxID=2836180 RepID=UPI001BD945AC|nr:hypothetical protein [Alteromonas oceanisediminis]MBT0585467.1 hypothetical protein [Alteromonas oceanisediminis]
MKRFKTPSMASECESLVQHVLDFAAVMLQFSDNPYPFAAIRVHGRIECVFCPENSNEDARSNSMIEQLEWLVLDRQFQTRTISSVVAFCAEVETAGHDRMDVIVTKIDDGQGLEVTRLYPFSRDQTGLTFSDPISY